MKVNHLQFPNTLWSRGLWIFMFVWQTPPHMSILESFPFLNPVPCRVISDSPTLSLLKPYSLPLHWSAMAFFLYLRQHLGLHHLESHTSTSDSQRPWGLESNVYNWSEHFQPQLCLFQHPAQSKHWTNKQNILTNFKSMIFHLFDKGNY